MDTIFAPPRGVSGQSEQMSFDILFDFSWHVQSRDGSPALTREQALRKLSASNHLQSEDSNKIKVSHAWLRQFSGFPPSMTLHALAIQNKLAKRPNNPLYGMVWIQMPDYIMSKGKPIALCPDVVAMPTSYIKTLGSLKQLYDAVHTTSPDVCCIINYDLSSDVAIPPSWAPFNVHSRITIPTYDFKAAVGTNPFFLTGLIASLASEELQTLVETQCRTTTYPEVEEYGLLPMHASEDENSWCIAPPGTAKVSISRLPETAEDWTPEYTLCRECGIAYYFECGCSKFIQSVCTPYWYNKRFLSRVFEMTTWDQYQAHHKRDSFPFEKAQYQGIGTQLADEQGVIRPNLAATITKMSLGLYFRPSKVAS